MKTAEHPGPTNVLIVEDDPDDAYLLERALTRAATLAGSTVHISRYSDGWEAIRAVGRSDVIGDLPDFVVVDLNMPVMDGLRFLEVLRSDLRLGSLPTFVLTTSDRTDFHRAAYDRGADCVFQKPDTHVRYLELAQLMYAAARFEHARRAHLGERPQPGATPRQVSRGVASPPRAR